MNVYNFCLLPLTLCIITVSSNSEARKVTLQRTIYTGECYSTDPLSTFDRCSPGSASGAAAIQCAIADAMNNCRSDDHRYNLDCHTVATSTKLFASEDFPGWRKCTGIARVHGYEKN